MNNFNFDFDCRDNSQNRNIQLTYNEQAETEFITQYASSDDNNCFLCEEHLIKKCNEKYDEILDNMMPNEGDIDDLQFADSRRLNEIEKIKEKAGRKKKVKNSKFTKFEDMLEQVYTGKSYTFVQDLEQEGTNSVKAVACKKQTRVKVSTRFISTKLLINAKMLLASFIYVC